MSDFAHDPLAQRLRQLEVATPDASRVAAAGLAGRRAGAGARPRPRPSPDASLDRCCGNSALPRSRTASAALVTDRLRAATHSNSLPATRTLPVPCSLSGRRLLAEQS